jgi:hypothetical protein
MSSTDRKLELKAMTSMAQTGSQAAVYAKGLNDIIKLVVSMVINNYFVIYETKKEVQDVN